jgi:prepilin-type N-terminal cleavage/methylation domain-containing protein
MISKTIPTQSRLEQRKKGFTLTEIAIVLGIIGLILGAIWAAASGVYANLKANQGQQGILSASQAVRSMYATSANTGIAVATPTVITTPGEFPVNWQSSTPGIVGNPWHLNPTVNFAYVVGAGQQFAVEIDGISDAGCAQLSGFYNMSASSQSGGAIPGLVGSVNSKVAAAGGVGNNTTMPTALAASATAVGGFVATAPLPAGQFAAPDLCTGGSLNDGFAVIFDMSIM